MAITREMKDKSRYFKGNPKEDWELLAVEREQKYNIYYYQDKHGGCHHTSVKRKGTYDPFDIELREEDGMTFARMINKKTGQPIRR